MKNKKGFEFSFAWMFAMIVGAAILFLAIYGVVRLIGVERAVTDTEAAKQLGTILTPAETGSEEAKIIPPIKFPSETRFYNNCTLKGNFGEQLISIATSSGIGEKWREPGFESRYYNKYIFSKSMLQGKEFYVFAKPFLMPYKAGELIFMWANNDEYCLVSPPREIEDELSGFNAKNINFSDSLTGCTKKSRKICFYSSLPDCDVVVNPNSGTIRWKDGKTSYYDGGLVYGAIFSEWKVYECQVQRLMKKTSELALVYLGKSENIASRANGCSSGMQGDLAAYAKSVVKTNSSYALVENKFARDDLNSKNSGLEACKLW